MLCAFLAGSIGPFKNAYADDLSKGKSIYLTKCSKCHRLYDPKSYENEAWTGWMVKMKKKARLNDDQYERILKYLESVRKG